jgi:hypothetical protein
LGTTRMFAYLGISDSAQKLLSSAVDAANLIPQTGFSFAPPEKGVDPKTIFTVPEKVFEIVLSVEDLNHGGGPDYGYRLRATRKIYDFSLEFITPYFNVPPGGTAAIPVRVIRDSYFGPIQLSVANAGKGLIVEGGHIPANVREGLITVSLQPGASPSLMDLEVWGEGISPDKETLRRRAAGPGLITAVRGGSRQVGGGSVATQRPYQAKWMGMELPGGISRPAPVAFEFPERQIKLVQGLTQEIRFKLVRLTPISSPIRIEGQRPTGVDVAIKGGSLDAKTDSLPVQLSSNFNTQVGRFDMVLVARADLGGREAIVTSPPITVDLVRAFTLVVPAETTEIAEGTTSVLSGRVYRQYPFQEAVSLRIEGLPLHVTCEPLEVPRNESAFKFEFKAGPGAEAGVYDLRLLGTAKMEGRKEDKDYSIPEVKLRLVIKPPQTQGP